MAARLSRWIPPVFAVAMGGGLGWFAAPALIPDVGPHHDEIGNQVSRSRESVIGDAWLPLPELEKEFRSISTEDAGALLTKLEPSFWCGHPNGRDALRMVVRRLAEQRPPAELTRELFHRIASWELPTAVRAEGLRNLTAVLATIPGVTPEMLGEMLRDHTENEIRAAAAAFIEERRGESIERDVAVVHQFLLAAGLKGDELANRAAQLAAAAWFAEQPEAAISFALKNPQEFNSVIFRPMLRQLYALDPAGAVRAMKLVATNARSSYWTGESAFLTGLSAAEFREVWALVPKDEQINCLQGFSIELALQSPGSVLELTQQFSADELYTEQVRAQTSLYSGLLALLPHFAERDAAGCREWLNTLSTERRLKFLEDAATPLANAKFARLCLSDPESQLSTNSSFALLGAIGGEDLGAALHELPRVPLDQRLHVEATLHSKAILKQHSGDIAGILQALEQLPENIRFHVRANVYPSLAARYQAPLEQWLASNPDAPEAKAFQVQLATHDAFLSNAQRETFLARALPSINENPGVAGAAESYLLFLAQTDPISAGEWLARIPDGECKKGISHTIAERWAVTDMAAAVAWAEQLPPSPSRDGAFVELAAKQKSLPTEALQRIAQIEDGEQRFTATRSLVQEWALADYERAIAITGDAPLSEDYRQKLQEIVESSPTRIRSRIAAP